MLSTLFKQTTVQIILPLYAGSHHAITCNIEYEAQIKSYVARGTKYVIPPTRNQQQGI